MSHDLTEKDNIKAFKPTEKLEEIASRGSYCLPDPRAYDPALMIASAEMARKELLELGSNEGLSFESRSLARAMAQLCARQAWIIQSIETMKPAGGRYFITWISHEAEGQSTISAKNQLQALAKFYVSFENSAVSPQIIDIEAL